MTLAAACGSDAPAWGQIALTPDQDLVVVIVTPPDARPTLEAALNGATLAQADRFQIAGHAVRMERRSGDCDTEARRAANRENVVAVVLGRCAQDLRAALDVLASANLLTLVLDDHRPLALSSSTAAATALSDQTAPVLRLTWADDDVTPILVRRLRRSLGVRSAALIRGPGAATAGAAESFRLAAVREGLRLTPDLRLDAGPAAVAATVRESGAPAVYLATTAVEALGVIIALDAAGWAGAVLLSPLASDAEVFAGRLDGLADGVLFTRVELAPDPPDRFQAWQRRYTARFSLPVDAQDEAPLLYDALLALVDSVRSTAEFDADGALRLDRYSIYAALRDGQAGGVAGPLRFSITDRRQGDRDIEVTVTLLQVQGAALQPVEQTE